jgi:hypothetical protein
MNEKEKRKSDFTREIVGCFISPRVSFMSILEKPNLTKATALILVIAIVAAWASYNYTSKLPSLEGLFPRQGIPGNLEQLRSTLAIASAIAALIGIFGTWLISSALVHGFSRAFRGKGTFRNMLTLAGYASIPLLVQHLLRLVDSFIVSQDAIQLETYFQMPLIAEAALSIFTVFGIWSMGLLIVAVRENYTISTIKSTATTMLSFIILVFILAFLPFM